MFIFLIDVGAAAADDDDDDVSQANRCSDVPTSECISNDKDVNSHLSAADDVDDAMQTAADIVDELVDNDWF